MAFAILIAIVVLVPKGGRTKEMPSADGGAANGAGGAGPAAKTPGAGGVPGGMASSTTYRITTVIAKRTDLHDYLKINGDVEADDTVAAYPDTGGKLVRFGTRLGSRVSKGDVIAEIDPSKPGESYSLSPVYAPISGTVTSMPIKIGSTVSTLTVVAYIGDIRNLQIAARISERDIAVLKKGLKAEITFEAYPDAVFKATVFSVSPVVDSTSRTKDIYLSFDTEDARINAGMFAKIKLYTTVYSDCVTIPEESIVENNDVRYVYLVGTDKTVKKTEVTVGSSVDGVTQILTGLSGGERVAYEGITVLSDGVTVKDISQSKADTSSAGSDGQPEGGTQ